MKKTAFTKILIGVLMTIVVISSTSSLCFAESISLDDIGGSTQVKQGVIHPTTPPTIDETTRTDSNLDNVENKISDSNKEAADGVKELFKQGALTQESIEQSKKISEPIVKCINLIMAIILGLLSASIVFISVLDLVYIQIPASRSFLAPNQSSTLQANASTPNGITQSQAAVPTTSTTSTTSTSSTGRQWVSDEAIASLNETQSQQQQFMTLSAEQAQPKSGGKTVLVIYMKKRTFALVVLGICLVMFTCTIFTDIGVLIGTRLVALLSGF